MIDVEMSYDELQNLLHDLKNVQKKIDNEQEGIVRDLEMLVNSSKPPLFGKNTQKEKAEQALEAINTTYANLPIHAIINAVENALDLNKPTYFVPTNYITLSNL